jgi:hypothetical protein
MHPAGIWQKTGRWTLMGDVMFRLKDRKGADLALGVTHEEIVATLALELSSTGTCRRSGFNSRRSFATSRARRAGACASGYPGGMLAFILKKFVGSYLALRVVRRAHCWPVYAWRTRSLASSLVKFT